MISTRCLVIFLVAVSPPTTWSDTISNLRESNRKVNLKFESIPPTKIVALVGSNVEIPCEPIRENLSNFSITWTNQGSPVKNSNHEILDDGTIFLEQVTEMDNGNYLCKISSGKEAIVSTPILLNVTSESDFWNDVPANLSLPFGSRVRISCSTLFFQDFELCLNARIKWLRGSEYIDENAIHRFVTSKCGVLYVMDFNEEVEGNYRCELTLLMTGEKILSPPGTLKVLHPPSVDNSSLDVEGIMYLPPSPHVLLLSLQSSEVKVILGHRVVLECLSNDKSTATPVKWSRSDNRPLRKDVIVENGGNLIISRVTYEDGGTYECALVAGSEVDIAVRKTLLQILRPPVFRGFPPTMNSLRNGDLFRFNCSAAGVPTPSIEFFKDGRPYSTGGGSTGGGSTGGGSTGGGSITQLVTDNRFFPSNTTVVEFLIRVVQEEDEGIYQCVAKNSAGVASKTARLTLVMDFDAPDPPINIRVKYSTSNSILYQWDPPKYLGRNMSNSSDYLYHTFFGRTDSKQHVEEVLSFETLEKLYTKLQSNTSYTFYIRVLNLVYKKENYGISLLTKRVHHMTKPENPRILSAKLNITTLDSTTLRVRWKALPVNSEETEFVDVDQVIQWWTKGLNQLPSAVKVLDPKIEDFNITDVPVASTKVKVLIRYIPDQFEHPVAVSRAHFDILNYSEWAKVTHKKMATEYSAKERLQLFLTANTSTSVLSEWTVPEWMFNEEKRYNLTFVNDYVRSKRFTILITDLNYHFIEGLEPACYEVSLSVMSHTRKKPVFPDVFKSEAAICTLIRSSLLRDQFENDVDKATDEDHVTADFDHLLINFVHVGLVTSESIMLQWTPSEHSLPDFYLIDLKEIRRIRDPVDVAGGVDYTMRAERSEQPKVSTGFMISKSILHETEDLDHEMNYIVVNSSLLILTKNSVNLTSLTPNTEYEIRMTPGTIDRIGVPSDPQIISTLEGVPSVPRRFEWFPVTTSSVNASWAPPSRLNGNLKEYLIVYSHDLSKWENKSVLPECTHVILTGLVSNTKYSVRIYGVTGGGPGDQLKGEVFIQAILDRPLSTSSMSMEMIIICIISTLVIVTGGVLAYLITTMCRLRRRASRAQATSPSRPPFTGNGIKDKDVVFRPDDSKGQNADDTNVSQIEATMRHLDTKGRQNIEENLYLLETPMKDEVSPEVCEVTEIGVSHPLKPDLLPSAQIDHKRRNHFPGKQKGKPPSNFLRDYSGDKEISSTSTAEPKS